MTQFSHPTQLDFHTRKIEIFSNRKLFSYVLLERKLNTEQWWRFVLIFMQINMNC